MGKRQYYQQKSIQDAIDSVNLDEDEHLEEFRQFLIHEQLSYVHAIPFKRIINDHLQLGRLYKGELVAHSLVWRYTADLITINGRKTYSFRFPNVCDLILYETFSVQAKHLFQKSTKRRHRSDEWYRYTGRQLRKYIGRYLNINEIFHGENLSSIKLFVYQKEKRLDIFFYFESNNTTITITFEKGSPIRSA